MMSIGKWQALSFQDLIVAYLQTQSLPPSTQTQLKDLDRMNLINYVFSKMLSKKATQCNIIM